jgi:hypothetical protein
LGFGKLLELPNLYSLFVYSLFVCYTGGIIILQEAFMTEAEFEVYMKHEFSQEETDERVAWFKQWNEELHQANLESPLPDDFIDYCKGRKFFRQTVVQ